MNLSQSDAAGYILVNISMQFENLWALLFLFLFCGHTIESSSICIMFKVTNGDHVKLTRIHFQKIKINLNGCTFLWNSQYQVSRTTFGFLTL